MKFFLCLLVLCVSVTHAQTFGDISGEVKDASGAVIPGATVIATHTNPNTSRNTITNEATTRPGTNEFHGTAYWFHRNSAVDAHPYDFDGIQQLQEDGNHALSI